MNFTYQGGTPKQVRWFQDAVDDCSFPVNKVGASVAVVWGALPSGADTHHPYMVTQALSDSSLQITIASWADDPTNPNNKGLPNPDGDIYDFYKQSVVHELGHVMTYLTFDPGGADTDARIGQMCELFWTATVDSGNGRRYGTRDDWDAPALSWAEEIREAVAEIFKCVFYKGRLVFMNRTRWRIDKSNWPSYLKLLTWVGIPNPNTPGPQTSDAFSSTDPNITGSYSWDGALLRVTPNGGSIVDNLELQAAQLPAVVVVNLHNWDFPTGLAGVEVYHPDTPGGQSLTLTAQGAGGAASIEMLNTDPYMSNQGDQLSGWYLVIWVQPDGTWFGGALQADAFGTAPPFPLAIEPTDGFAPALISPGGGTMEIFVNYHHLGSGYIGALLSAQFEAINDNPSNLEISKFYIQGPAAGALAPNGDYPFEPIGELSPGPGAGGVILVGAPR